MNWAIQYEMTKLFLTCRSDFAKLLQVCNSNVCNCHIDISEKDANICGLITNYNLRYNKSSMLTETSAPLMNQSEPM